MRDDQIDALHEENLLVTYPKEEQNRDQAERINRLPQRQLSSLGPDVVVVL